MTAGGIIAPLRHPVATAPAASAAAVESIRTRAEQFTLLAVLLLLVGCLAFLTGLYRVVATENSGEAFDVAGFCTGLSTTIYLVAQVIHIRANTLK